MSGNLLSRLARRKKLGIALILLILLLGPYLVSRVRAPERRVRLVTRATARHLADRSELRVATFNIAHGRGAIDGNWAKGGESKRARILHIASQIKKMQADVVVLNEVDFQSTWSGRQNQAAAIAEAAGYACWVEQRNFDFRFLLGHWKFGNAILSRVPISDARPVDFPAYRAAESFFVGKKRGVICTLHLTPDKRVRLLGVHLEPRSESVRVESARTVQHLARSGDPLIVAGDFNSTPRGYPQNKLSQSRANAMMLLADGKLFRRLPGRPPLAGQLTYSTTRPDRVIDWILIPPDFRFLDYQVIDTGLSDHRAVVATIAF